MPSVRAQTSTSLGYLVVYAVALVVGLASLQEGTGLAFFWPAAGVAALWMLHGSSRAQVLVDGGLLVASTAVVNALSGVDPLAAGLFGLANLVVGLTLRVASARIEQRPFFGPLPRRVAAKRDLGQLATVSFAAALTSAPFGLAAAYVATGSLAWGTAAAWIARNTGSTFVVVAAVLAILTTLLRAHARRGWSARLTSDPRRHWVAELVLAGGLAIGSAAYLFGTVDGVPIAFLLVVPATWLGYRFSPVIGGSYALFIFALAVLCTQAGRGPFAPVADDTVRAITVQVFVMVIAVLLLVLSLGVGEREALLARVVDSEARATSRAELLDAVMHSITDGLVVLEPSGRVTMSNRAATQLGGHLGLSEPASSPQEHGFSRPDGAPIIAADLPHVRALAGRSVIAEDLLRIDPDTGHQAHLSVSAVPLRHSEAAGGPLAVVVMHDVTQERSHRRELQAFAGTVAHDLKTPLTGVRSWAEILGDDLDALGVDVTEPRASLRRLEASALRMQQLIADLLAYSQAQSALLRPSSLSLTALVDGVARELRDTSAGDPPRIEHGPLGRVRADKTLVQQLLTNVIGNAVKYVAPGTRPHVLVSSAVVGDMLEVRVADNGIGIPRAERGRIFDSFYRASSSGSYPGTGLGLAICARAVERHGGRISALEGLDGAGTTVVFTLPADLEPVAQPRLPTRPLVATRDPLFGSPSR